ncbi:hypothetical protein [Ectopseudomonas khazarica]|uniref:hypothetical protein n=1 Tax=Ectopseudomonas khazarica TaxID=2502979 RepID=UPI0037C94986
MKKGLSFLPTIAILTSTTLAVAGGDMERPVNFDQKFNNPNRNYAWKLDPLGYKSHTQTANLNSAAAALLKRSNETDQTVGNNNGPEIIKQFPVFKNDVDQVQTDGISYTARAEMKEEAKGCIGELDSVPFDQVKKQAENCFASLERQNGPTWNQNPYLTIAELSSNQEAKAGYLRALSLVSSIVDSDKKHQCMASVYKEGVWVTAKHCVPGGMEIRYLLRDSEFIPIKSTTPCKLTNPCDIVFIQANTPHLEVSAFPKINPDLRHFDWKDGIFVPGIVYKTPLRNNSTHRGISNGDYISELMWSPYGVGYCRVLDIQKNGCFSHTCSTLVGFSGAPVYAYDTASKKVQLIGIHSGADKTKNNCTAKAKTNYGRLTSMRGVPL